jgi:hypothetical protein
MKNQSMSGKPKQHPLVDFAARNARLYLPTFNASSAIWRLEALIDDAVSLQNLREQAEEKGVRFGNRLSTYEIFSYFVVGFATCLEWHARSRIVDLLHFGPSCIETTDVKMIDKLALSQMSAEKVTLPYIVGAGTHVSSVQEYVSVFTRIFDSLGLPEIKAEKLLREQTAKEPAWRTPSDPPLTLYDAIGELFITRNELVHEVGVGVMAHFSLRDIWTPEEALRVGRIAVTAAQTMEKIITERTPSDFPNRLDSSGYPEDEIEKLASDISEIEKEITEKIGVDDWNNPKGWEQSISLNRAALDSEMKFLDEAGFLKPVWHLDFTRAAKIEYLQSRRNYLRALLFQLNATMGTEG